MKLVQYHLTRDDAFDEDVPSILIYLRSIEIMIEYSRDVLKRTITRELIFDLLSDLQFGVIEVGDGVDNLVCLKNSELNIEVMLPEDTKLDYFTSTMMYGVRELYEGIEGLINKYVGIN